MWLSFRFSGNTSTLFVILVVDRFVYEYPHVSVSNCKTSIEECLKEKLSLIPNTKLVIICGLSKFKKMIEIPPETVQVYLHRWNGLGALLEHLNKRYKSLDLISVMMELRRTVLIPYDRPHAVRELVDDNWYYQQKEIVQIHENLSCLPRLQKMEQMLEKSDP